MTQTIVVIIEYYYVITLSTSNVNGTSYVCMIIVEFAKIFLNRHGSGLSPTPKGISSVTSLLDVHLELTERFAIEGVILRNPSQSGIH